LRRARRARRGPRPGAAASLALALALAAPAAAQPGAAPRAAGGVAPIEAAETAPVTLVASVAETRSLDARAFSARLHVEQSLRGPIERGAEVRVAWEELAAARAPRFAEGERILVSLEPLPGDSIWRERLPDAATRAQVLAVARRGDAFLRRPSAKTLLELEHYLALPPAERRGPAGVARLATLAFAGDLQVAEDAVRRLDASPDLDAALGPFSGAELVGALVRDDASDSLRDAVVELVGSRRLESTRPALQALVQLRPAPPAAVFEALARLDGGLPQAQTRRLLGDASPARRAVAARHASGPEAEPLLRDRVRSDPDASVRAAAVERLAELRGAAAADVLALALADPEPPVRAAAVQRLGALGDAAVPELRRVLDGGDPVAARSALAALSISPGSQARALLVEIADSHEDADLQRLAGVALGRAREDH
jgi:hypothetical protein